MKLFKLINIILITVTVMLTVVPAAFAVDPLYIGVGARPIGMGKAYVAVAEDGETLFMNPAGLGAITGPKLTSMYTNLLGDVKYAVVGGAYPTEFGTFGAGFVSTGVSDIALWSGSGTPEGTASYGNNVIFVSYGFELASLAKSGFVSDYLLAKMPTETELLAKYGKNIYLGGSLKYFSQGGSGVDSEGNGSGINIDLGILFRPNSWLSFGFNQQNALPMSFGGGMTYSSGIEESMPSVSKIGAKVKLLGETGLYKLGDNELDLALDYDMNVTEPVIPTSHLGLEYWVGIPREIMGVRVPKKMLAIRAGLDQDPGPEGVINNVTAGIGFRYAGFQFDYAYHPYNDIPENTTHYFSISYVGPEKEEPKKVEEKKEVLPVSLLDIESPQDKFITIDDSVNVKGSVKGKGINIAINSVSADVKDGKFEKDFALEAPGKHLIAIRALDKEGVRDEAKRRILKLVTFADVPQDFWAVDPIEYCATAGLVEGYPDGTFKPKRALSRAELATLLVRAKGVELPKVTGNVFPDVPKTHWAAPYIKAAMDMGLVKGYPDGTFKPNNKINKVEGVVVLARFNGAVDEPKAPLAEGPFKDMVAGHWAAYLVIQAKEMGMLEYIKGETFWPQKELLRAEAVEILSKTMYAKDIVEDLLDFETGYEESILKEKEEFAVSLKSFSDVPEDYFAKEPIEYLATAGIVEGFPDGTFKPERTLTRAEFSTLLVKASGGNLPAVSDSLFSDLPGKHWASRYVKAAVDMGLVKGYPDGTFKPNSTLNRAEAVTVLARFDKLSLPENLEFGPFRDMNALHWAAKYVYAAKEAGILDYLTGGNFEPEKKVTRGEAAEMLSKTSLVQEKIKELKEMPIEKQGGSSGKSISFLEQ